MNGNWSPRILVVNDDEIGRYAIGRSLRQAGFEVMEAATGETGLDLARTGPDLVLLDVNLPDLSGIEVCRRLKEDRETQYIPVLHVSATFVDSESQVRGLESGADGYLNYPLEPPVLVATIRAHLRIREVEAQRRELALMLEDVSEAIIVTDPQFRIESWNRGAQEIYGFTPDEAAGAELHQLAPMAEHSAHSQEIARSLEANGRWEGSLDQIRRDGETIHVLSSLTLVTNGLSGKKKVVAVNRDVTELRRAEEERERLVEELSRLNDELERRVEIRTMELTAANRALESRTDELEALAYSISHDLRSPLRGVDGFSQILLEEYSDSLDGKGREYLQRVKAGARLMGELIDHLLQLSRLSRRELQIRPVDLSRLAQESVDSLRKEFGEHQVEFRCDEEMVVKGDEDLLRTLLRHLLHNAFKFTTRCPNPFVEFGCQRTEGRTAFYVRDNGIGFNMDYEGRLFTAFQQLHSDRELTGTGIGLATVRRIVHRHGGTVWASSKPSAGATFYFTLPQTPQPPRMPPG